LGKKFPSLQPHKNQQGIRRYTQADLAQLSKIYQLVKKQRYTLQGAKEAISHSSKKLPMRDNTEIIHTLKNLRKFLVHVKENMTHTQ
jgi:DNA-binding transcriptional MerR regulator